MKRSGIFKRLFLEVYRYGLVLNAAMAIDPDCLTLSSADVPESTPSFGVATSTLAVADAVIIKDIDV